MKPATRYLIFKRLLDIVLSLMAIIILSWLFIILILINTLCAYGRPLYFDERVGKNGKNIRILKFTSMRYDAERNAHKYLNKKQMKQWKKERKVLDDPRVTRFGRILRKTSLDELPQLFNILAGSISIVGPRPITRSELEYNFTNDEQKKLLSVKPGLTGNWAVNGRNNNEYKDHKRQFLELEYVDKISFKTDFLIILKTFRALFRFKEVR